MDINSISQNSGIYVIINIQNNKAYVGQAKNIRYRWQKHEMALRNEYHKNRHLQAAWNKYGATSFEFYVLEYCQNDKLNEREIYYIALYKSCGLSYNATNGGEGTFGYKHTDEVRTRLSEMKMGHKASIETKIKLSAAHKGRVSPMKGKHHSEQTRQRISEAGRNRKPISKETRDRMSAAQKGHPVDIKTRQAVSNAQRGKIESKDTRLKKV